MVLLDCSQVCGFFVQSSDHPSILHALLPPKATIQYHCHRQQKVKSHSLSLSLTTHVSPTNHSLSHQLQIPIISAPSLTTDFHLFPPLFPLYISSQCLPIHHHVCLSVPLPPSASIHGKSSLCFSRMVVGGDEGFAGPSTLSQGRSNNQITPPPPPPVIVLLCTHSSHFPLPPVLPSLAALPRFYNIITSTPPPSPAILHPVL